MLDVMAVVFTIWFVIISIMIAAALRDIGVELKKTNFLLDQLGKGLLGWGDQR